MRALTGPPVGLVRDCDIGLSRPSRGTESLRALASMAATRRYAGIPKEPNTEPIPGYRLIERIGTGGFGEVWKCEARGGLFKAIKFVRGGLNNHDADEASIAQEMQAVDRVKVIRHPFLLSMERVEMIDGCLVIVMELADQSLRDLLAQYQAAGSPGIPRRELLRYLNEAAEVLDVMLSAHGLQHLDIKPANLLLVSGHVKVADLGLVGQVQDRTPADSTAAQLPGLSPCYAAPERFRGVISPTSDQYSLAIVYQ